MIKPAALRIGVRILIFLIWFAIALADVIIVDDPLPGFAIMIAAGFVLYKLERKLCGMKGAKPPPREGFKAAPEGHFWLQYADGHYRTLTDATASCLFNTLGDFPWEDEIAKYHRYKDYGVAPGIGLGRPGDAHFLHVTATTPGRCNIRYTRRGQKPVYRPNQPTATAGKVLAAYMKGDEKKLLEALLS